MLRTLVDFLVCESAERVSDDDGGEIVHTERIALHLCLVQEFRGHDNCRGAAGGFQSEKRLSSMAMSDGGSPPSWNTSMAIRPRLRPAFPDIITPLPRGKGAWAKSAEMALP